MLERVVFRDGGGRVRHCTDIDWESYVRECKDRDVEQQAVELCRVGSREEAMRFVNLARENDDAREI